MAKQRNAGKCGAACSIMTSTANATPKAERKGKEMRKLKGSLQIKIKKGHPYAYDAWYDPTIKNTRTDYLGRADRVTQVTQDTVTIAREKRVPQEFPKIPQSVGGVPQVPQDGELTNLPIVNLARRGGYKARFALKEEEFIKKYAHSPCLHLFCGVCEIGDVRVDINPVAKATLVMDVFTFLSQNTECFETVIYDPLYSADQRREFASKYNLDPQNLYYYDYGAGRSEKTHALHHGVLACHPRFIICKSWNFVSFWRDNGYYLNDGFIGILGGFRRPTYLLVFERGGRKLDAYLPKNREGE